MIKCFTCVTCLNTLHMLLPHALVSFHFIESWISFFIVKSVIIFSFMLNFHIAFNGSFFSVFCNIMLLGLSWQSINRWRGLINRNYFLLVLEVRIPRSMCQQFVSYEDPSPWIADGCLLSVFSHGPCYVRVCILISFSKNTSHVGLGLMLKNSF